MRLGRCGLVDAVGGCRAVCVPGAPGARPGLAGDASWGVPSGGPGGGAEEGAAMEDGGFAQQAECLWNEASLAMLRQQKKSLLLRTLLTRGRAEELFNRRCTLMHADDPSGPAGRQHPLSRKVGQDRCRGTGHLRASAYICG